ncbi:MAG: nitroreductase [Fimbriimonadaceae bacterium]|nr:nitroreductase [Chitinophagales bacterium]
MMIDVDQVKLLIQSRRSVKPNFYTTEIVSDEIIYDMLESARWAPTHGLTEPWKFFVFSGNYKHKLADFLSELYQLKSSVNFLQTKYEKIKTNILKTSHVIMIGMQRQINGKIPEVEEICAVACAVQNMQLTATAYGIGCYWSTGSMSTHSETKNFLGLREADVCLGMLYVSNYTGEIITPKRTPTLEKTVWIKN